MKRKVCLLLACLCMIMAVSPVFLYADVNKAEAIPMYDCNDEVIAWLQIDGTDGYTITDRTGQIIVERSSENGFPYEADKTYYFAGPLEYYTREEENFVHVKSGEVVASDIVAQKMIAFTEKTDEMLDVVEKQPIGTYSTNATVGPVTVSGSLKTYNGSATNQCGSYATAILLVYYKEHGYSKLVSDTHYKNTTAFINYLTPHIEAGGAGSTVSMLVNGIDWYLGQAASTLTVKGNTKCDYNVYKEKINNNQPVILGDDSGHRGHWVVGYGYKYDQFVVVYNKFAIVNDCCGNNGIEINWSYIAEGVYLESMV